MASVNSSLIKHNLILGVDDRGKLSCHKVNLCFIYFDATECIVSTQRFNNQRTKNVKKPIGFFS